MKMKLFLIVCLALLLIGPGAAQAARGDREELNFAYVNVVSSSKDQVLVSKPIYVYAMTVYPDNTSTSLAYALIYDLTSAPVAANGEVVAIELAETIQYATERVVFDIPILLKNGAYVDVTGCSVVLEYR